MWGNSRTVIVEQSNSDGTKWVVEQYNSDGGTVSLNNGTVMMELSGGTMEH